MRHSYLTKMLTMVIVTLMFQLVVFAQPKDRPMPPTGGHVPPDEFIKELKKELNLTSEQEDKIQRILNSQQAEMNKMFEAEKQKQEIKREEMKKEHDTMREQMEKQRKEIDAQMTSVLTKEQAKKFEEMQKKHSEMPPPRERQGGREGKPIHEGCPDHRE